MCLLTFEYIRAPKPYFTKYFLKQYFQNCLLLMLKIQILLKKHKENSTMISFAILIFATMFGGLLAQIADSKLSSALQYVLIVAYILNILLVLLTKYCEANENLFSHIQNLSFWQVLPHIRLYLTLRPHLQLVTFITLVIYPAIYLTLYIFDLKKIIFVFLVVMFLSMVVSMVLWGWVLSWFLMGWPTPIRDEEVEFMNRLVN